MASEQTTASGPVIPQMPACEPVEVLSVAEHSIAVLWLHGGPAKSTVGADWRRVVHETKEECIERLNEHAGKSASP